LFSGRDLSDPLAAHESEEATPVVAGGKPMGFLGHLEELRGTLIKCAIVFGIFVTVIAYNMENASMLLTAPLHEVQAKYPGFPKELVTISPMSIFSVVIDICLMGGVVLSLPFWLFFLGQFVAPALTRREMKVIVPTGMSAFALFVSGTAFGYYVLTPSSINVAFELNQQMGYTVMWTAEKYYSLLMWLTLGMGAAFEFPLLVVLGVYMGLVEVKTLLAYWRHAFVVIFIIAAIVTPTTDPINMVIFAAPLMVLYFLAIIVASQLTRRRKDEVPGR
jgi:sec-independent protein translocase protein TatC